MNTEEEWQKVPGVPDYYEVSNTGRIRSLAREDARGWNRRAKELHATNAELYLVVGGAKKWFSLAALVLRAFVGPPPEGKYLARHLDDNRKNNKLENLAWGDDADNHEDAKKNGANFTSYGHLGKKHSEKTKRILSKQRRGVPTGRRLSEEHKAALTVGYRKKFPAKAKPKSNRCFCGCGAVASPGKAFIHGHAGRVRFKQIAQERVGRPRAW